MRDGRCPKCASADVIPNVFVLELGHGNRPHNLKVVVDEHPDAWLFKGEVQSSLKAWVCGACGYTELFAKDAAALLAAYRKHAEKS
jgi:predicted nucleic-acid-binding Zn-ribbon protein